MVIDDEKPCCDNCANGHTCSSETKEILARNESEFDSKEMAEYLAKSNAKPIADVIGTKKDA